MNEIKLMADNGEYLCFYADEAFLKNGKSEIEIKVSNYYVRGFVWFSFGELNEFLHDLTQMYERLQGEVVLQDSECNLAITFSVNQRGYVVLKGHYKENLAKENELRFELEVTQAGLDRWKRKMHAIMI